MRGRAFDETDAFTLIELLIAFAISTILLMVIYLFYISTVKVGYKTGDMAILNMVAENKLELMCRELREAVSLVKLTPSQLSFTRYVYPEGDELSAQDLRTRREQTVTYRLTRENGKAVLLRQEDYELSRELFRVDECTHAIFKGYVLELPSVDDVKHMEGSLVRRRFHLFDPLTQDTAELARIVLVEITLNLKDGGDSLRLRTKVALPLVLERLLEPDWNE